MNAEDEGHSRELGGKRGINVREMARKGLAEGEKRVSRLQGFILGDPGLIQLTFLQSKSSGAAQTQRLSRGKRSWMMLADARFPMHAGFPPTPCRLEEPPLVEKGRTDKALYGAS
jgi:hypothetical protein